VDVFILARLKKSGLSLAPSASRESLLRRVTFDLTGLPPTPAELQAFLRDARPGAYERVVDRLLASPRYGERWAQHWLDVVRYAETNGYEADGDRPDAWRYRDYVVRSLNADKPYDRFVVEQLAGDQLARAGGSAQRAGWLIAAGFNRCGPVHLVGGNTDPEVNRQELLTEMTGAVGSTFLGLTLGCARCHHHKFDPISQQDYYRLQAFFAAVEPVQVDLATTAQRQTHARQVQALAVRLDPLRRQLAELDRPYQQQLARSKIAKLEPASRAALSLDPARRTAAQQQLAADAEPLIKVSWDELLAVMTRAARDKRAALRARIHALEAQLPAPPPQAWTIADAAQVPPTHVLRRGDPKQKGVIVRPAFPRVLLSGSEEAMRWPAALDRRALATWLVRPEHPLTGRVMVNRIWQHHFGRGIVATPNDLGSRGQAPTHPALLDWLACEFTRHGWSVKHMHRLMVLSSAYRQGSQAPGRRARQLDPENRLMWHIRRRRLEGEALRDSVLAVAGTLSGKAGGPPVRVPLEPEVYELIFTEGEPDGLWPVTPDDREHCRRSLYLFLKRNVRLPLLESFDKPDTLTSCPVRAVSTFAPQALIMLNSGFMQEQSRRFAGRLRREYGSNVSRQIEGAYRLALGRPVRSAELALAQRFLAAQEALLREQCQAVPSGVGLTGKARDIDPAAGALADFCLAVLNCNEFTYVP
jgi:hypothetical protein